MNFLKLGAAAAALTLAFSASAANATVWYLNYSEAQSGLPAPYGSVEVTQSNVNELKFVVTLFDGLKFVDTGAHYAFSFSLDGAPAITLTPLAGYSLTANPGAVANSPFSGFDYGLNCPGCDPNIGGVAGPLTFYITGTGLTLSMIGLADPYNGNPIRFAADTISPATAGPVNTGTIGGGDGVPGVPEPATWAMLIMGFGMVGMGLRMRRNAALSVA